MKLRQLKALIVGLVSFAIAIGFQNCGGDLVPLNDVVVNQGIFDAASTLDEEVLAKLIDPSNIAFWSKSGAVKTNNLTTFGDAMSLIVATKTSANGVLLKMNSGADTEEASISLSAGQIKFTHKSDATNFSSAVVPVPTGKDKVLIAASFATDSGKFTVLVDGKVMPVAVVNSNNPFDYGYLLKTTSLGTDPGILEAVAYGRELSARELNSISRFIATSSEVPGVIFDPSLIDPTDGKDRTLPTQEFLDAKEIIDMKCATCHTPGSNGGNFTGLTQSQALARGLIVRGDPSASPLYNRLIGSGGAGNKDMPKAPETRLTEAEILTISNWINSTAIGGTSGSATVTTDTSATTTTTTPSLRFVAAKGVIDSNCLGCHGPGSSKNFSGLTEADFITRGFVVKKNLGASRLYYRLTGASSGPGPMNMPTSGPLTPSQVNIIADWIANIP